MTAEGSKIMPKIEGLLSRPPADWPWALPHLYCVETVSEPGEDLVGYSAHKDGSGEARVEEVKERTRVNVIGFWKGVYAVTRTEVFLKRKDAELQADASFKQRPIQIRARDGMVIATNEEIKITGDWPKEWSFHRASDWGVFCAFLYQELFKGGHKEEAESLKKSLRIETPGTEMLLMFQSALTNTNKRSSQWLTPQAKAGLDLALSKIDSWIR
jgi:hypothetical protein